MSEELEEVLEEIPQRRDFSEELIKIIRNTSDEDELRAKLDDYHYNDLAEVWEELTKEEHIRLYNILGAEEVSEIFAYFEEDASKYLIELGIEKAADILEEMDADDAVDILEDFTEEQLAALKGDKEHPFVEVLTKEGSEKREIETGVSDGISIEVKKGLQENESVIIAQLSSGEISDKAANTHMRGPRF